MSRKHQYRIRIEPVGQPDEPEAEKSAIGFEFASHDDLATIIRTLAARPDIGPEAAAPLGLGIKLFGSIMLEKRNKEPFASLFPHFSAFMKSLKSQQG